MVSEWLETRPRFDLYAQVSRERPGFLARLFGRAPVRVASGELHWSPERVRLVAARPVELSLVEPVAVQLSVWHADAGAVGEVAFVLRAPRSDGRSRAASLGVRIPWPSAQLELLEVPQKREIYSYLYPEELPALWPVLGWLAQVHGTRPVPELPVPSDLSELAHIASPPGGPTCTSCDAPDLVPIGVDAYLCNVCGYEGGDGMVLILAERRRRQLDALEPDRAAALIASHLADAGATVHACADVAVSVRAGFTSENSDNDFVRQRIANFVRDVLRVRGQLDDVMHLRPELREELDPIRTRLNELGERNGKGADMNELRRFGTQLQHLLP